MKIVTLTPNLCWFASGTRDVLKWRHVQNTHGAFFMNPVFPLLYLSLLLASADGPRNFTIMDYWERKCNEGEQGACVKLERSREADGKLEKLNALADTFRDSINPQDFMLDEKPNLGKAYPVVLESYLESFPQPGKVSEDKYAIDYCSKHFHNYWLNKKFWWPTDAEDKPDWSTIYVYIVDHYHGICLNRPF